MTNTVNYEFNTNQYCGGKFYCRFHHMSFDIRCTDCFQQFGNDPDVILLNGKANNEIVENLKLY